MQIFLYLFFINNLFITSSLIIGSGAVIQALTGELAASALHCFHMYLSPCSVRRCCKEILVETL